MKKLISAILGGALAGAVGTYAMDRLWYRRYRRSGGRDSFMNWEISEADSFDAAGAPAKIGQIVTDKIGIDIPDRLAGTTTNVVHWATGMGWGALAGLARAIVPAPAIHIGLATGVAAWGTAYAVLPRFGIYESITEYDVEILWKDLSAHIVFGLALGLTLRPAMRMARG